MSVKLDWKYRGHTNSQFEIENNQISLEGSLKYNLFLVIKILNANYKNFEIKK